MVGLDYFEVTAENGTLHLSADMTNRLRRIARRTDGYLPSSLVARWHLADLLQNEAIEALPKSLLLTLIVLCSDFAGLVAGEQQKGHAVWQLSQELRRQNLNDKNTVAILCD